MTPPAEGRCSCARTPPRACAGRRSSGRQIRRIAPCCSAPWPSARAGSADCSRAPTCSRPPWPCVPWASTSNVTGTASREVHGVGIGGLAEADRVLDLGNAGTGAELLLGLLAGHPFPTFLTGDDSLRARPMGRVITPLQAMGARFSHAAAIGCLLRWSAPPSSCRSAIPAGRLGPGQVGGAPRGPARGRADHGDRAAAVARPHRAPAAAPRRRVEAEDQEDGTRAVSVLGQPELAATTIVVPGDFSSAAFPLVAAALAEGCPCASRASGSIRCAPGCSIAWRRWARASDRAASGARRADRGSADRGRRRSPASKCHPSAPRA